MLSAVYNSLVPQMPTRLPRCFRPVWLSLVLIFFYVPVYAADWSEPERQLAHKIAGTTGPGAVYLEVTNRSSLSKSDVDSIRGALRSQLNSLGLHFVKPEQAAAVVRVFLSEDLQSYVWAAQVTLGETQPTIVMVSVPRSDTTNPVIHEPAVLLIRKIQLWSQDDPMLDVAVVDSSPPHVIILDPGKIALYGLQNGHWQLEQSFPLAHARPWPSDVRGRVLLRKDHLFDAYLPGVLCSSTATPPLTVSCRESDDPWPLGTEQIALNAFFSPTRNFFTGALAPGVGRENTVPPFYSAAPLPREKYVLWLFAATDGQVREVDGMSVQTLPNGTWGSDIASVKTGCGSGWQVLATGNSDGTVPDSVRAFEFPDRDPVLVSQPVDFNGNITSLWTEASGSTAVVVARNLETGKYEALRLTITCGQ
jgi:hypothetical protein